MMDTLQRIIGLTIGVIVAGLLIVLTTDVQFGDVIVALAVGAIAAFFWPIVVAFFLARRAKSRRDDKIQAEVQRQMNDQNRG